MGTGRGQGAIPSSATPRITFWLIGVFFCYGYLFLRHRERQSESRRRDRERGGYRIGSRLPNPRHQHRAQCGAQTHKPRDHDLSQRWTLNLLSHLGTPENISFLFFSLLFFSLQHLFTFERQSMSRGGAERETQNPKQAPGSELSAQSPTRGSNSQTVRS